jgi:hypothetical protein
MKISNPKKYLDVYDQERYLFEKIAPQGNSRRIAKEISGLIKQPHRILINLSCNIISRPWDYVTGTK